MKKISLGKLRIVYTERKDGDMKNPLNRKYIADIFGLKDIHIPNQKHTNRIFYLDDYSNQEGDGLYTDKKFTALGVLTADCMPVVLTDGKTVAVVHAGWRGLFEGILEECVSKINKEKAMAFIGPSARICCYAVQEDFLENIEKYNIPVDKRHLKKDEEGFRFSLQEVAKDKLKKSGINHIIDISLCTICKKDFFSYRKGDFKERILTFAWLED
jgi:YfiH family protein